jgi:hypothetical protein
MRRKLPRNFCKAKSNKCPVVEAASVESESARQPNGEIAACNHDADIGAALRASLPLAAKSRVFPNCCVRFDENQIQEQKGSFDS